MNIFIMILVTIFMVGYYMITAPSQRIVQHETQYAVERADMHAIAECTSAMHNAQINGVDFSDPCVQQYDIFSEFICLNSKLRITNCEIVRNRKPDFSYIITATAPVNPDSYNNMMEIMEQYYADAGSFGILSGGKILAGGISNHRTVPDTVIDKLKLTDGQLVYFTQYEMPGVATEFSTPDDPAIVCPAGTIKTYRFGRWQCVGENPKMNCAGDTMWDADAGECVADNSRKPLCGGNQTAIMIDDIWECVDPTNEIKCPSDMIARYNYNSFGWECVPDPDKIATTKKCSGTGGTLVYGGVGSTLSVTTTSCTDCEVMITDPDTCATACMPDITQINNPKCYPGPVAECSGPSRGFYFGFPDASYITRISQWPEELMGAEINFGGKYSQNRKFNCMDCGAGTIDREKSVSPYTAVCK